MNNEMLAVFSLFDTLLRYSFMLFTSLFLSFFRRHFMTESFFPVSRRILRLGLSGVPTAFAIFCKQNTFQVFIFFADSTETFG